MLWAFTKLKEVEELLTAVDLVTSFGKSAQHLASVCTLIETLPPRLPPDVTFLFKGSHGMVIDKIVWEFGQSAAYPFGLIPSFFNFQWLNFFSQPKIIYVNSIQKTYATSFSR